MKKLIYVEGIIGAGKTTFCNQLHNLTLSCFYPEPVQENIYLDKFYANPKLYSFPMETFLLFYRYENHLSAQKEKTLIIFDRSIYGVYIFIRMLFKHFGYLSANEFHVLDSIFQKMVKELQLPDLIIFLDVPVETSIQRMHKRDRSCEKSVNHNYQRLLREEHLALFSELPVPVKTFNFLDNQQLNQSDLEFLGVC